MQTHPERKQAALAWFDPLSGWEAATRWNAATFDWMARGWQQWLSLLTTLPRDPVLSANALPQAATAVERPMATAEPKRSARAAATGKPRTSRSKPRARTRG